MRKIDEIEQDANAQIEYAEHLDGFPSSRNVIKWCQYSKHLIARIRALEGALRKGADYLHLIYENKLEEDKLYLNAEKADGIAKEIRAVLQEDAEK